MDSAKIWNFAKMRSGFIEKSKSAVQVSLVLSS